MRNQNRNFHSSVVLAIAVTFFFFWLPACGDSDADSAEGGGTDVASPKDTASSDTADAGVTDDGTQVPDDAAANNTKAPPDDTASPPEEDANSEGGDPDTMVVPDAGIENPDGDDDSDMLTNAEEVEWGTDPLDADSDGDGYLDGHEVMEGKDPMDDTSVIYQGGWPYNPDKDNVEEGDWNGTVGNGELLPRFKAHDQYGDLVDIYDLMNQGRMVVLDVGTWFCEPCKAMAAYFSSGDITHMEEFCATVPACWWKETYTEVLDLINNDQVYWVTVLFSLGSTVTHEDAALWHDTFPHDKILVLADSTLVLKEYLDFTAMPHIDILDETLHFISYNHSGPTGGMNFLINNF